MTPFIAFHFFSLPSMSSLYLPSLVNIYSKHTVHKRFYLLNLLTLNFKNAFWHSFCKWQYYLQIDSEVNIWSSLLQGYCTRVFRTPPRADAIILWKSKYFPCPILQNFTPLYETAGRANISNEIPRRLFASGSSQRNQETFFLTDSSFFFLITAVVVFWPVCPVGQLRIYDLWTSQVESSSK